MLAKQNADAFEHANKSINICSKHWSIYLTYVIHFAWFLLWKTIAVNKYGHEETAMTDECWRMMLNRSNASHSIAIEVFQLRTNFKSKKMHCVSLHQKPLWFGSISIQTCRQPSINAPLNPPTNHSTLCLSLSSAWIWIS